MSPDRHPVLAALVGVLLLTSPLRAEPSDAGAPTAERSSAPSNAPSSAPSSDGGMPPSTQTGVPRKSEAVVQPRPPKKRTSFFLQPWFWAGVFATFAMALGTAITVSALAVLAVVSRDWAARMADGAGGRGVWVDRIYTLAALGGSALVFVMGLLLLWGSLGPARPF